MTSAYEQNRRNLQNSRNIDPNRFQDQMDTVKQFVNPEDPTFISELFLDLKTGYSAAKNTPGGPYIKGGSAIGAIGLRRLIKQADIPGKIVTNFNDIFKGRTASLLNPPPVSKVNTFNLNDLKAFSFATKVDDLTGITNVKSEVMQMLSKGDDLDIFVKGSNSDLSYKKIAKDYRLASGAGLDLPVVEGYKAANPKTWNKYVLSETKHWAQHGKGSGKYFTLEHLTDPKQNKRFRFDNKGLVEVDGQQVKKYSKKDLAAKKGENKVIGSNYRAKKLERTITLDEYIAELGEDLGRKGYDLDQARFKRLYRWVGKNVHLDHINPIGREGFHHPSNLILLHAKDNLAKNAKVLPDSFFKEMGIPKTKAELIRSSIENTSMPPKIKRKRILEVLGIID